MIPILVVGVGVEQRDDTPQRQFRLEDFVCVHDVVTGLLFTATRCLHDRRNPGEPIILVLYGPWHFFFALFPEMMISRGR